MMRRSLLLVLALLVGGPVGCQSVKGMFSGRGSREKADDPLYNIDEQQRRGREKIPLPEENTSLLPYIGSANYGPAYR